jgi:predicted MFS family arabinose efflux permease
MFTGSEPGPGETLRGQREFHRYWTSRTAAVVGNQMMLVALGWQMYDLTGRAWDLGLVGLVQFAPALLLALPAGHVVDRHDRKAVLMLAVAVQGLVALALAAASYRQLLGRDGVLALSALLGAARAFQMPASQALVPLLVPRELLPRALALASSAMQGAIVAGPALGGVVYGFGPAPVYALATALFAAGAAGIAGLKPRPAPPAVDSMSWASLLAGLRFLARHPVVLGATTLDLFAVLLGGATALLPIFARDILGAGPAELGMLRAAPAAGAVAISLVLAHRPVQRRAGARLLGAVAVYGVAILVFGLSRWFWLSLAALAASGAADMVSIVVRQSLVQLETPDAMRGRVSAVNAVFIGASNQLGEFESGATAAWLGATGSVVVGGIGTLAVVALWVRLFPALARRDRLVRSA